MEKRREFLQKSLTGIGGVALGAAFLSGCDDGKKKDATSTQVDPSKTYKWRMAMTWGQGTPILAESAERFAQNVKMMSGGRMTIEIDGANKHKAPLGVFDMVKEGQYDMGHSASYYWKGKDPSFVFFTTMPFGLNAQEQNAWFYYGGGNELMDTLYKQHNLYSFNGGNTSIQMGGWFKKEIKTIEDFKGLKMRIPGFAGEVLSRVGAVPTNIAPGELYTSLEMGNIDALEWVSPALDLPMGFAKIAKFYYTGWHEPASELQFLINRKKYDALPEDLRSIIKVAAQAASFDMLNQSTNDNAQSLQKLKEEYADVQILTFSKEIMARLKKETEDALNETAAKNKFFADVLNSQREYLAKVRDWSRFGDYAYLKASLED